jgi:hypothetical protein
MSRTAGDVTSAMIRPILGVANDDGTGALLLHEFGWTANGVSRAGQIYAETGAIDIDNGDRRFHVKQIEQDFAGDAQQVAYRFFCRERAAGPEVQAGPYPIVRFDGQVDCRFSARRVRMRIEAVADGPWALGVTRLDVVPAGSR